MRRILIERVAISFLFLVTVIGCITLVGILAIVTWKGSSALSTSFLFTQSYDFGAEGGIFYQAMGTFILMMTAGLISLPVSIGSVLFQSEYLKSDRIKRYLRLLMYSLNGVPTIIFGLVGYLFFGMFLGLGISWVTGALILTVMILPTVQMSIQETVDAIPEVYRDTGSALGLNVWQQIRSIIIPQSLPGIIIRTCQSRRRNGGYHVYSNGIFLGKVSSRVVRPRYHITNSYSYTGTRIC
jgi:phosphate transport system permease protein